MRKPSLQRLIEFHQLLNSFAEIERIVHINRHKKHVLESNAEHTCNLALMAWFVADYFPELDRNRVVLLALAHDLVEIHAGDTFIFADKELLDSKTSREAAARDVLAKDWPDFPELHDAIAEYKKLSSSEACFTYALDKIMPIFAIYLDKGYTWHDKQITLNQLADNKRPKVAISPQVLPYWDALHDLLKTRPDLFPAR